MAEQMDELIGPYERWAHGAGARYTLGPKISASRYVAAVAELPPRTDPEKMKQARLQPGASSGAGPARVFLPTLWKGAFGDNNERVFCPLVLDLGQPPSSEEAKEANHISSCLSALGASFGPAAGFGFRVNAPIPATAVNSGFVAPAVQERSMYASRPPAAIVAVIDDGIPFAHRNLRDKANRSRIEFCWLQGAQAGSDNNVLLGKEYTADDINALINACGHDEDALYRTVLTERRVYPGATINRLATHGAHVLDAAAGHRHGTASASARPVGTEGDLDALRVIAVQLPASVTLDTTGFGKDAFILSAFHYIFDRADRIAQKYARPNLPLIINFSYGFSGGPHKGGDRLERAIRALIRRREKRADTQLVMPSGNDFLSALYGKITADTLERYSPGNSHSFDIPWRVQPSDRTSNYLEIWLPQGANPGGISIKILDPAGACVHDEPIQPPKAPVRHTGIRASPQQGSRPIGQFSIERYRTGEREEESLWRMVIALAPTEPNDPAAPAARPGLWRVRLENIRNALEAGAISCRIQRDNDPFGYARGARQSYFDDPLDAPFEASGRKARSDNTDGVFVRRFGTLNGLATHDAVTVVGGYVAASGRPADYSSAGSNAQTGGSVHYSAPSETSSAIAGILAGGTRSGAVFRMAGTSAAAPQVSRELAVAYLTASVPKYFVPNVAEQEPSGRYGRRPMTAGDLLQGKTREPGSDEVSAVRLGKGLLLPKPQVHRPESAKGR
jgi:hypothetical protein